MADTTVAATVAATDSDSDLVSDTRIGVTAGAIHITDTGAGYYGAYDPYDYGSGYSPGAYTGSGAYSGDSYNGGYNYDYGAPPQTYAPPMPPSGGSQADSYYRRPDYYLIAFSDHSIQAAISYRVDGDQLYYTTRDNVERHVPLSSVDRRFSEQLNRDRRVQFQLPQ